jgi:hypothetical protein
MQPIVFTSKNGKPIEQWSKEEAKQWLSSHFSSLPTSFLEKGFIGKHLIQLATTGASILKDYVPDDFLRLELIDMIDKQHNQGTFHF